MSVYVTGETVLDGRTLGKGSSEFRPCCPRGSYARYVRDGCTCGVVYRGSREGARAHLRVSPGYQIPEGARSKRAWNEFAFGLEDDRVLMVRFDDSDGEVYLYRTDFEPDDLEAIERAIDDSVDIFARLRRDAVDFVRERLSGKG